MRHTVFEPSTHLGSSITQRQSKLFKTPQTNSQMPKGDTGPPNRNKEDLQIIAHEMEYIAIVKLLHNLESDMIEEKIILDHVGERKRKEQTDIEQDVTDQPK